MARLKQFSTKYGYLTQDGTEFVITTPRTPRPWTNVVSNGDAGFVISQTGGGYSWRGNAQMNRLTRWEQDILKDEWGKYLFVRDRDTGQFWSAAWKPVMREPDRYEVRHGVGYSVITSVNAGIETEWRLFVAPDDPVELWRVTVRNLSRRKRRITLFSFFEWGLGAAPDWHREFHKCFSKTEYDQGSYAILATKRLWEIPSQDGHWNADWKYVAFHAVNVMPKGFDCSKESFLGPTARSLRPRR
jgi:cellobiose phosphorylase